MSSRCARCVALLLLTLTLTPSICPGQGTAEDYRRAAGLRERFADKVRNERLTPHWAEDGQRFWFRRELAGGGGRVRDRRRGDRPRHTGVRSRGCRGAARPADQR